MKAGKPNNKCSLWKLISLKTERKTHWKILAGGIDELKTAISRKGSLTIKTATPTERIQTFG